MTLSRRDLSPMRPALLTLGVVYWVFCGTGAWAQTLPAAEAARQMGQTVSIEGTVKSVDRQADGNVRISFKEVDPSSGITVLVLKGTELATDPRLTLAVNHRIDVKGKVETDEGRPEIKVTSKDQVSYEH